jgi:hypothetical protein
MKATIFCSATLFSLAAFAFPANLLNNINKDIGAEQLAEITELAAKISREVETKRQLGANILPPGFDAKAQLVSTTGDHKYVCSPVKMKDSSALNADDPMHRSHQVRETSVDLARV